MIEAWNKKQGKKIGPWEHDSISPFLLCRVCIIFGEKIKKEVGHEFMGKIVL
jgi:hypothetical protein